MEMNFYLLCALVVVAMIVGNVVLGAVAAEVYYWYKKNHPNREISEDLLIFLLGIFITAMIYRIF